MTSLVNVSSLTTSSTAAGLIFTSLPREVRDIVYGHLFNHQDHIIGYDRRYYATSCGNKALDNFLIMIHDKAFDSWVAREMCEAFWFAKFSQHTLDISWLDLPKLLNPGLVTRLETTEREPQTLLYGIYPGAPVPLITPISPKDFVTDLEININEDKVTRMFNEKDLCELTKRLPAVLRFPRLRRAEINLWVPRNCNCYWEVMPLVEAISHTCRALRRTIGINLNVWIMRNWTCDFSTFRSMDHDISWMWEVPGQEVRMIRGVRPATAAEDRIRTLMSMEFRPMGLKLSVVQELRDAASLFPQRREDVAVEEGGLKEAV